MAEQCIKTVWSGMHFSERIWRNARNKLAPRIERHVIDCVIGGRSKDECIKEIKRDFDVGFNDADRLVRTEVMNVINRAQCETYASEGIKKVKWITGRDNRMCEHCGSLEGKIFELRADGTLINPETGISQPVIVHPRCRCTIIPIVEFEEKELTNGANGDIIELEDIIIPRNVGAAGRNYPVKLPNGNHAKLVEGTKITKIKVIMGYGTGIPLKDRFFLESDFHIPADKWQKVRGEGFVVVDKKPRKAELHWYEADGYREKMKVKEWLDES